MDDRLPAAPSSNGHTPTAVRADRASSPPTTNGRTPPATLFIPVAEQIENVRRWNDDLEWGFGEEEFAALDPTPRSHPGRLVVDVVVPYLDYLYLGADEEGLDGVRHTCHELWLLAAQQQPNWWCWDRSWDIWVRRPKPVRLLAGIVHRPGIRRVTVDLAAHWKPGRHLRPAQLRGPDSAHAEVLAAAAHFPRWVRAMDGRYVPHTWVSGYQITVPEYSVHKRLPALTWTSYRQTISLAVNWADRAHSGFASPVCVG